MAPHKKAEFLHVLAANLEAGRSLRDSCAHFSGGVWRDVANVISANSGDDLAGRFQAFPHLFNGFDIEMIRCGDTSGHVETTFRDLADYYSALSELQKRIIKGLRYPVFLVHFAALALAAPAFVVAGFEAAAGDALRVLAWFYLIGAAFGFAGISLFDAARSNTSLERIVKVVPFAGRIWAGVTSVRFCSAFQMLISAGIGIVSAFERAGVASGSPSIRAGCFQISERIKNGVRLPVAVESTLGFPRTVIDALKIGDGTGEFEKEIARARAAQSKKLYEAIDFASNGIPQLVYFVVAGFVAWKVVQSVSGYFGLLESFL